MRNLQADSVAFRKALLRSESHRILGVAAFLLVFAAAVVFRIVVFRSHMSPWGVCVLLLAAAYEFLSLRTVNGALKTGRDLPFALWVFNIILEMVIPALGIAFFQAHAWLSNTGRSLRRGYSRFSHLSRFPFFA
jgi:hypothetical protein